MQHLPMYRRLAGLAVLTAILAVGISPVTAADEQPVELPTILSVTGGAGFIGKESLESVQLVAGIVNAHGGVRGKQVKVVLQDTTTSPAIAVQLLNQLIANHVQAVFGAVVEHRLEQDHGIARPDALPKQQLKRSVHGAHREGVGSDVFDERRKSSAQMFEQRMHFLTAD